MSKLAGIFDRTYFVLLVIYVAVSAGVAQGREFIEEIIYNSSMGVSWDGAASFVDGVQAVFLVFVLGIVILGLTAKDRYCPQVRRLHKVGDL